MTSPINSTALLATVAGTTPVITLVFSATSQVMFLESSLCAIINPFLACTGRQGTTTSSNNELDRKRKHTNLLASVL